MYLGGQPIDHVAPALARAKQQGARSVFVTNNASRPPAEVAASLAAMGVAAEPDDVLTSPQAAAVMLADRHPAGTKVLVIGAPWLAESVTQVGLVPVRLADGRTRSPSCRGIRRTPAGANWPRPASRCGPAPTGSPATSTPPCRRTAVCCPATASMVAALVAATGLHPRVAGKPERPLLDAAVRLVDRSGRWWSVTGWTPTSPARSAARRRACWCFTGVSTAADLLAAVPAQRPTYLAFDMRGLVEEDQAVRIPAAVVVAAAAANGR